MKIVFHPFAEKFPLLEGAEFDALVASIKATKGNKEQPCMYRTVGGKPQGLDGRNRERACKAAKVKCVWKSVRVPDEEVLDYILRRNVHRRHMTTELRQTLVAEMRAEGMSEREIAKTLGTTQSTVHRDIQATDANDSLEGGKVTGSDGRQQAATKSVGDAHEGPVLCARCKRAGAVKDCPKCVAAQAKADKAASGRKGTKGGAQKNGQPVYDWRPFNDHFGGLMRQIDTLGKMYGQKESPPAEKLRDDLGRFKAQFTEFSRTVKK